jgi:N-acetylglucosamine kinase-like BadF-type ATPase
VPEGLLVSRWLVGVDAGASRSTACVGDPALEVAARIAGPPGALVPGGAAQAAAAIAGTVRQALETVAARTASVLVVGAAGAGWEPEREALEEALKAFHLAARVRVTTDIAIALVAAFGEEPGILLLAGTGSVACARLPSGAEVRAGGHGWQFGDEGSGYALARAGLAAVAQAGDGRGPPTQLTTALARAAGVAGGPELLAWARRASRSAVADLARTIQEVAAQGDPVAVRLVEQAASDLAAHVFALQGHFPPDRPLTVALAGGLLREGSPVRLATTRLLRHAVPRACLLERAVDPARGALRLAARWSGEPPG